MNLFKRSCLMAGGAAFVYAGDDFSAGRFWPWVFDLAVIAVALYLAKPSKEAKAADEEAHEATATIERVRALADDMRQITGARAWADRLDATLPPSTPDDRGTACRGCTTSLAKCRAEGARCCDLCQHATEPKGT